MQTISKESIQFHSKPFMAYEECPDLPTPYNTRRDIITYGTHSMAHSPRTVQRQFSIHVAEWKRQTRRSSVIADRYQQSDYKAILEMPKPEIISLILDELRREPDRWFAALCELTGEDPANEAINFYEAVDRWVAWGISKGYLE